MSAAIKTKVTRIDPTDWFVGMKNPSLQLMIYGTNVSQAEVSTDYPGVTIDSIVRPDSPNYLFVYLNLKDAKAGEMPLRIGRQTLKYTLHERETAGENRRGFTNADVLYMLMPDRFAQGKVPILPKGEHLHPYTVDRSQPSLRHGGNLDGIFSHLDYFNELGVTALWLTPVLENNSPDTDNGFSTYHGYATTDYYRVDPRFGTNRDYRRLTDEAHAKGLKVVMDMIFNHCGLEHPWVNDWPTKDWFNVNADGSYILTSYKLTPVKDPYASDVDLNETTNGWFVPTMPDLNQRNHLVMDYLIQNSLWWIETVGIDGIRMDTYPYADAQGMMDWMNRINEEYPNFNVVGETWVTEPAFTASYQKDGLKTVMDFAFFDRLSLAKSEETDGWWKGLNRLYNSFCYDYLYEDPNRVMAFIDNHDTDRFLGNGHDSLALRQALALLLTVKRIPQIYYGTEIMMNGTKEVTDGNVRRDFPGGFPGDQRNCFVADGRTRAQQSMFAWFSRVLHWRQGSKAVVEGTMKQFIPYEGIYVIARHSATAPIGKQHVMTILNGTSAEAEMPISRYAEVIGNAAVATDITNGRRVSLQKNIRLRPRQTMILEY